MTVAGWIALAITVFGAFSYAAASILQSVGARRSTGTVRTMGHPLYLIGTVCDLLAWAGSMIALRELAVYLVESVLAGSLAVTVVAARVILKSRLRGRDVAAVVVSIAGLTVLAMSAGPQQGVAASNGLRLWFCAVALAMAVIGWGTTRVGSPGVVAATAGLCLGGAALAGRALPLSAHPMQHPSAAALAIVTEPLTAALVTFAVTGMLLYAHALQHGQVGPVTAVLWIAEVIAPSAAALMFLGDTVRPGWNLPAAVAGLVAVGAAALLATAPANNTPVAVPAAKPRTALLVMTQPAHRRYTEKAIPWGPPPIWVPPNRTSTALPAPPARAALTWNPPQPLPSRWADPHTPDADIINPPPPAIPATAPWPTRQPPPESPTEPVPSGNRPHPWHDL